MYRIFKFIVSGGSAAVINLSILYTAVEWFHLWYILAATISFTLAVSFNFTVQRLWVFENRTRQYFEKHLLQFFTVAVIGTSVNAALMYTLVDIFHVWYMLAQVLIMGALACVNFFLYQRILGSPSEYVPDLVPQSLGETRDAYTDPK